MKMIQIEQILINPAHILYIDFEQSHGRGEGVSAIHIYFSVTKGCVHGMGEFLPHKLKFSSSLYDLDKLQKGLRSVFDIVDINGASRSYEDRG